MNGGVAYGKYAHGLGLTALVAVMLACAPRPSSRDWTARLVEPDARFRDDSHPAVVLIGDRCSGVLVRATKVLTAAHCLPRPSERRGPGSIYPPPLPSVHLEPPAPDGDVHFETEAAETRPADPISIVACAIHPGAYPGVTRCVDRPDRPVVSAHDLAIVSLERPFPDAAPIALILTPPVALPRHLWLVGWHRRPRRYGSLHRYAGRSRVVGVSQGTLTVQSEGADESESFATHRGNSGGPALARVGDGYRVMGVLSRHRFALPRRSFYAYTAGPENAAWLRSQLGE